MKAVIDTEIELKCGKPYQRSAYECYRQGTQKTEYVAINGQKHQVKKPRIVTRDEHKKEVSLETYEAFQNDSFMESGVMAKLLHGVSTRDYAAASEAIQSAYGIEKSNVSRHYVKAIPKLLWFSVVLSRIGKDRKFHHGGHIPKTKVFLVYKQSVEGV